MRYRAKKTLNLGSGRMCRAGQVVPKSYGRLEEAIKRGWVEPITDEEHIQMLESAKGQPPPSLVTIPKAGSQDVKDEGTTFIDKEAGKVESDDEKSSYAWNDTKDWKKPTGDDTDFEKESPIDSGEADLVEEASKEEDVAGDEIGLDTLVVNLPFIKGRAITGLKESGIVTVADLAEKTMNDLTKIKGIGDHTAIELIRAYDEIVGGQILPDKAE